MQKEVYEFISKQTGDPIIEWRTCAVSGEEFPVYEEDIAFYKKAGPLIGEKKYPLQYPTLCPAERWRRRLARRTMTHMWKTTCAYSGKPIISMYPPETPYVVYHQDIWHSDVWDPLEYGQEIDWDTDIFSQYHKLLLRVPRMALINVNTQNAQYVNYTKDANNCHMSAILYYGNEYIFNSFRVMHCSYCSDVYRCEECSYCIQCSHSANLYNCYYVHQSMACSDCVFVWNCENCDHCILCENLVGQSYCIRNQPVSKEEYDAFISTLKEDKTTHQAAITERQERGAKRLMSGMHIINGEACIGDGLQDCQHAVLCWDTNHSQDCRYVTGEDLKDCQDMTGGTCELVYESFNVGLEGTSHIIGCSSILHSHHMYYCDNCYENCSYCFACTGLKNASYCIFNKQYTKEEWHTIVAKLIKCMITDKQWGEFLPIIWSPLPYNESRAGNQRPLSRGIVENLGYWWRDEEEKIYTGGAYTVLDLASYDPEKVGEGIAIKRQQELLAGVIVCPMTQQGFKITKLELDLYLKMGWPLPYTHNDVRQKKLRSRKQPWDLYLCTSSISGDVILSTYPDETSQHICSRDEYQKQVYG